MTLTSPEKQEEVRSRLNRLESQYRQGHFHGSLFDYPILLIAFIAPATLLVAFIVMVLIPRFGQGVGTLMGLLSFVLFVVAFNAICDMLSHKLLHSGHIAAIRNAFNKAFPVENEEEREMALDILDRGSGEFSIAKMIIDSQTRLDANAFDELIPAAEQADAMNQAFVFQCDPSLLERGTIEALKHHGNWLQGLAAGRLKAETRAQVRFVGVHKGNEEPSTQPERIWQTYQETIRWQSFIDAMDDPTLSEYLRSYPYADQRSEYVRRRLKQPEAEPGTDDES